MPEPVNTALPAGTHPTAARPSRSSPVTYVFPVYSICPYISFFKPMNPSSSSLWDARHALPIVGVCASSLPLDYMPTPPPLQRKGQPRGCNQRSQEQTTLQTAGAQQHSENDQPHQIWESKSNFQDCFHQNWHEILHFQGISQSIYPEKRLLVTWSFRQPGTGQNFCLLNN